MSFDIKKEGDTVLSLIKLASWFPYKSGNLKFNATKGQMISDKVYEIEFDSTIAPYVTYLEEGTRAHNIPGAFGKDLPFGTSGRFDGKFHPGSTKHKGFIKDKSVNAIIDYFINKYKGELKIK